MKETKTETGKATRRTKATQPSRRALGFGARLRAYLLAGILVTAPVSITLYLAWLFISFVDEQVNGLIPEKYNPETYLPFSLPGLGLLVVLTTLILIGMFTAGYLGRLTVRLYEYVLARMPVIRTVYGATKQVLETVLKNQSNAFRQVVLVEYPRRGIWAIGFITGDTEGEVQNVTEDDLVNIFVPTTPNPTSGFLLFFPRRDLHILSMSVEDGVKMVVSGGIVTPPDGRPDADQHTKLIPTAGSVDPERSAMIAPIAPSNDYPDRSVRTAASRSNK